mgnify:CR=1 FL=1
MEHTLLLERKKEGFTLLELLIVIAILAILGAIVIFVLNPAETLRKTRDAQRISDLATIKSAIGLYVTSSSTPSLDGQLAASRNTACRASESAAYASGDLLYYSVPSDTENITDTTLDGSVVLADSQKTSANYRRIDGDTLGIAFGWIPVHLKSLSSGSPIEGWPVDPVNTVVNGASTASAVTNEALVYRYVCEAADLTFEVDANLESSEFTTGGAINRESMDGGNNNNLYETGTNLRLLGAANDF